MGRYKLIDTPEKMWELFTKYKNHIKSHPREKVVFVGKDGEMKREPLERPLTMEGFENFVAELPDMPMDLGDYFSNRNDAYKEFSAICSRIKKAIRQDQIEGGMVGQYNPSITQRLNGLTEKTESKVQVDGVIFKGIDLNVPKDDSTG